MVGRNLVSVLTLLATAASAGAQGVQSPPLLPHRAVYDLELKNATERSGIDAIYGRMVYEFTGNECKGYTTRFRFATRIGTGDDVRISDQRLNSFEDMKSGTYRFENQAFTDEQLDKEIKGTATRTPVGISVELSGDPPKTVELAESVFPTAHMEDVIANALNGKTLFDARTFDGSEDGDKSLLVTTIIGKPQTGDTDKDSDAKAATGLDAKPWWPVTSSYFNEGPSGDSEPTYRLSFKLYDNGVSRDLVMDYGDFALSGRLAQLDVLPDEPCDVSGAQ